MEHAAHRGELLHDGKAVRVRIAVMDNNREIQLLRERKLGAEHLLLKLPRRILLPVVVQPDLPDGNDLRIPCHLTKNIKVRGRVRRTVLRVIADGGVDARILRGKRDRLFRGHNVAAGV